MPTATTFDSLKEDVRAYIERGTSVDPTVHDQIPRLINLAEREIARSIKILGFLRVVTNNMSTGVSVYQKPSGWKDTVQFNFGVGSGQSRTPLYPRSYEYCRTYWPDEEETDQPKFYAEYDFNHWLIAPTPDDDYPFEVSYYQLPPQLDDSNTVNWLTQHAPELLLYGTLLQASRFLGNDKRIPVWKEAYDREISLVDGEDLQRIIDRSTTRQEV